MDSCNWLRDYVNLVCMHARLVVSDSFSTPWTIDSRLLCPWNSPGKSTGVSCHFPLQGFFPTQGLNPHLLHWQADSLPLWHLGSPYVNLIWMVILDEWIKHLDQIGPFIPSMRELRIHDTIFNSGQQYSTVTFYIINVLYPGGWGR